MLAAGAREIGAGHLDHRIEPETRDEFGSLIEAFNSMAGELATSQRKLERSRLDLERKNLQLDERRRYIETVLERIATGVVSIGADGGVETINGAALRLLDVDRTVVGTHAEDIFEREDLRPLGTVLRQTRSAAGLPAGQEITLVREGRELHLAAAATPLQGEDGSPEGAVLVFDDVTPLIRTQRVAAWRDVARRLAHEIKNPLTPIQLCAERIRRHFGSAPPPARDIVEECTTTIVGEVESLKALVDEFAQFARMPAPKTVPTDLHRLLQESLALYNGLFRNIRIEHRFDESLPPVRLDAEQVRRVLINLVDNAVEALGGAGAAERAGRRNADDRRRDPARSRQCRRAGRRGGQWSRHPAGGSRQAVHAVLLDQTARQRPRPRHRPAYHRRTRRQHRGARQRAAWQSVRHRVASVNRDGTAGIGTGACLGTGACPGARGETQLHPHAPVSDLGIL